MGDRVRIVVTAETEELGLAGKIGDVRGQTRPSSSQVTLRRHNPGATMSIGDKSFVRTASGEWAELTS
jgi:hypothetical protein